MASKPFIDKRRGTWWMKYKPDPRLGWVKVRLGHHGSAFPPSKPPTKPPEHVRQRAAEYEDIEWRAKQGFKAAVPGQTSLAGYVAGYVAAFQGNRRPASTEYLKRAVRYLLAFAETRGVTGVESVSRQFCREYLEMRSRSITPGTLKAERGCLSPIWSQAVQDELIQVNPWKLTKLPGKVSHSDPRFWTPEEVTAIVAACDKPWVADLVLILVNTGIRISATLAMRWDWVGWDSGLVTVPKEHDKGRKGYSVAFSRVARDVLQRRHGVSRGELVFPSSQGGAWSYGHVSRSFARVVARSGVPTGTLHDLRHTYGRLLARVAPISVVQASLGHASLQMTQRYTSVGGEEAVPFMEGFGVGEQPAEGDAA